MANLDAPRHILRRPRVTEKGLRMVERHRAYPFEVDVRANKVQIRRAVETMFKVKVEAVRTQMVIGKRKRTGRHMGVRPNWKKAIVVLREGNTIEDYY
jgi:large subunit ribosomal protein L23